MDVESLVAEWIARLRLEIPDTVAILLKGSYARGDAGPHSDVDFDVVTDGGPRQEYLAYLTETASSHLTLISVAVQDVDAWLAREAEPETWAFSFPVIEAARLLWATDDAVRQRLARPSLRHPPGDPELEDFVADFGKVKNARIRGDELAMRLAAQGLARLCPSLLRLVNPEVQVGTRHEALLAALDLRVSPPGYREDLLICLGLAERATAGEVYAAAHRLVTGVMELLRPHAERVAHDFEPDLPSYLANGTLQRYVAHGSA